MDISNRALLWIGTGLVALGALFLALNFLPGWSIGMAWPVIFFFLAAVFFLPPFFFPTQRQWIGAFFIPASILLTLGLIFLYNTITRDWSVWAYAWLLLIAAVGLGLYLAGVYSKWGRPVTTTGLWMLLVNVALFALFGAIFGSPSLRVAAPILLTLAGLLMLFGSLRRSL